MICPSFHTRTTSSSLPRLTPSPSPSSIPHPSPPPASLIPSIISLTPGCVGRPGRGRAGLGPAHEQGPGGAATGTYRHRHSRTLCPGGLVVQCIDRVVSVLLVRVHSVHMSSPLSCHVMLLSYDHSPPSLIPPPHPQLSWSRTHAELLASGSRDRGRGLAVWSLTAEPLHAVMSDACTHSDRVVGGR